MFTALFLLPVSGCSVALQEVPAALGPAVAPSIPHGGRQTRLPSFPWCEGLARYPRVYKVPNSRVIRASASAWKRERKRWQEALASGGRGAHSFTACVTYPVWHHWPPTGRHTGGKGPGQKSIVSMLWEPDRMDLGTDWTSQELAWEEKVFVCVPNVERQR